MNQLFQEEHQISFYKQSQSERGAGYYLGADITHAFLHQNGLRMMARAHQVMMNGFGWDHDNKLVTIFKPTIVTVWATREPFVN